VVKEITTTHFSSINPLRLLCVLCVLCGQRNYDDLLYTQQTLRTLCASSVSFAVKEITFKDPGIYFTPPINFFINGERTIITNPIIQE
jgi:hypothetical protein